MSAERPSLNVKNDIVTISLPYLEGANSTYLTDKVDAAGTTLTVKDTDGFANNDYLVLGNIGSEQTEITKIGASVSAGTSLTVGACTFPHPKGTKVTLIRYNQVALYGHATSTSSSPTAIGSAEALDVSKGSNEIQVATADVKAYYYARYYNSNDTVYSSYSDAVAAGGLTHKARGHIKAEFLSIYNERTDDLITEDWLNRAINRWQRELNKRRTTWACLRASTSLTDTTEDVQAYALPTTIYDNDSRDSIIGMKFYNEPPLTGVDYDVFMGKTYDFIGSTLDGDITTASTTIDLDDASDFASSGNIYIGGDTIAYTGKTSNQLTGVTGIQAAGHSDEAEVWQNYTDGQPNTFTVKDGYYLLHPIPDSTYASRNIHLDFWRKFPDLDDDADETLFHSPENCYPYLHWQVSIRRGMKDDIQTLRKAIWKDDLEFLVSEDPDFMDIRIGPQNMYRNPY